MSHGYTSISSKRRCIYCCEHLAKLIDEHIVPLSLGGQHVIREASCLKCADITKKFEQNVAHGLWGSARTSRSFCGGTQDPARTVAEEVEGTQRASVYSEDARGSSHDGVCATTSPWSLAVFWSQWQLPRSAAVSVCQLSAAVQVAQSA